MIAVVCKNLLVYSFALAACTSVFAQGELREPIRALGTFDQIADQCARGGSQAEIESYQLKLWHAYLAAEGEADTSAQHIRTMIASLRQQMIDDVSDELRRQYKSAAATVPDVNTLGVEAQNEFYRLCESPRVRGLPAPR